MRFFPLFFFLCTAALFAQDIPEKTISGTVEEVDWVESTFTVRYFDIYTANTEEINIKITPDTQMNRGTETISLSDLLQSDPVTVIYYDDGAAGLKARRITDMNMGNE